MEYYTTAQAMTQMKKISYLVLRKNGGLTPTTEFVSGIHNVPSSLTPQPFVYSGKVQFMGHADTHEFR